MTQHQPVLLMILDGWGIRRMEHGNAPLQANTPNFDRWEQNYERAILDASGEAVGLVPDQMGNSEVGHLNLGGGRIVYQDISRIDLAIRDGELAHHPMLLETIEKIKQTGKNIHLIGLLGPGGVHSHERHLFAFMDILAEHNVDPVIHVITDGRDTPPNSGIGFLQTLDDKIDELGKGRIASLSGRYYAMDRDKRWQRTEKAYDVMVNRAGERFASADEALKQSYENDVTDEFVIPVVIGDDDSLAISDGDAVIFYNFRADRMRQISQALTDPGFDGFETSIDPAKLHVISVTEYGEQTPCDVLFPIELLKDTLAETLSRAGLKQYHSAETEKYPHVTYFFNGRNEEPFQGEDRAIIPSPKVATYDLQPEMSAYELTEKTLQRIATADDDFILINFANPDMVGHTGSLPAAIKACETVDECANKLVEAIVAKGGIALVTADHGNCERMVDELTEEPHTYHTTSAVHFFVIGEPYFMLRPRGILADVAPTVLDLLNVDQPSAMTGRSLIEGEKA